MDKLLLTPTEAARALSIGRSKLYQLLQTGQLASVRIGTCRRVPADALTTFLQGLHGGNEVMSRRATVLATTVDQVAAHPQVRAVSTDVAVAATS